MQKSRLFFSAFVFLSLTFFSCGGMHHGKDKKKPGTWQATPIVIDGKGDDWPSPYPLYDSKALIGYATSNDKNYLYITLETGDEYVQTKILKQGLTVWIDTDGKKEQDLGIHFPIQDDNDPLTTPSGKGSKGASGDQSAQSKDLNQKIKRGLSDATQLTLEGFRNCNGGYLVKEKNPCGITVQVGIDEYKELIWEAAIPFSAIYGKTHIDKRWDGRAISVGFYVKGFKKPASNNDAGAGSGAGGGSGMGGGGGGMGGRGGGGRGGSKGGSRATGVPNPRDQLFESTRTWKQFGIAYQQ